MGTPGRVECHKNVSSGCFVKIPVRHHRETPTEAGGSETRRKKQRPGGGLSQSVTGRIPIGAKVVRKKGKKVHVANQWGHGCDTKGSESVRGHHWGLGAVKYPSVRARVPTGTQRYSSVPGSGS